MHWIFLLGLLSCASAATENYDDASMSTSTVPPALGSGSDASCNGVKDPATTSEALKKLSAENLASCLALLGKDRLQEQQAAQIWSRLLEVNGGAPEYIPEYLLRHLGWIAVGIPASHMQNLTLTDVDTVSALGVFRNLSSAQLSALAQAFTEQWPAKEPVDWTDIDLAMFGEILCGFNYTDIIRIHPDAYKMAAMDGKMANLRNCNNETNEALAKLAVSADAFGEPHTWQPAHVRGVGCVLSGLSVESLQMIPVASMAGLSADSVRCLPARVTSAMTPDQLANLSPAAAAAGGGGASQDAPRAQPFASHDVDYMQRNHSYPILNIVCGFTAVLWAALLWVAFENRNGRFT